MEKTSYRSALVLGCGVSGCAAAGLLAGEGTDVTVADARAAGLLCGIASRLQAPGTRVLAGCDAVPDGRYDVCVVSPGFASDHAWVRAVRERGVPVVSELALGASRAACPVLGVTGTNGKSTFVKLCADTMRAAGRRVVEAGNYGNAMCSVVQQEWDWIVAEVSSFQLEISGGLHPDAAVLLNIQPDHLNRHGTIDTYRAVKARLFACMHRGQAAVVPLTERAAIEAVCDGQPDWVTFGAGEGPDAVYVDGTVRYRQAAPDTVLSVANTMFDNPVLGAHAAAAAAVLAACGVPVRILEHVLPRFEPLPHRMEPAGTVGGVHFINDSKATNLSALAAALAMSRQRVHLIVGGQLKEENLEFVKEVLESRVASIYCIGRDGSAMADAWNDVVSCRVAGTLREAVLAAWRDARPDGTVLLSPGCASFDQFRNFEDRGETFKQIVRSLHEEK